MLRTLFFSTLLLMTSMAPANTEGICDISKRWETGKLKDGDLITIRGRITNKVRRDGDEYYFYDVEDTCPIPASVLSKRSISCGGQVTITGKFDDKWTYEFFGSITLWETQVSCK